MARTAAALNVPDGSIVAAVGAGGKKSLLLSLASDVDHAVLTATVHIPEIDDRVDALHVTDDPLDVVERTSDGTVGVVHERAPPDRYTGFDPTTVDRLADRTTADLVLVKADGARMRRFKAPGDGEPVIPDGVDVVTPVASIRAVGEPLDEKTVHRPEHVHELTGRPLGEPLTPGDVATVLTDPAGGLAGVPADASVVPVLNMVDDAALAETARRTADLILERSGRVDRVVLTCLVAADPVVDVRT